ncbi:MAG: 50S ribosomal protein L4 [Candidatus Yanofskybacteria bacterium RIFCSPLOWO2_01_FULL_49_25]|uniref:Large ribosomal subunit protein uL4 n=1 Tax=Candidatus Yanofskybacteria bacterium RIFCSPLOWO2_01_FULL_49_25 TaxID=1802701 RepID=A0A1F8GUU9_9BACT|nr:MAG: 50S ribosomal protein L4 [Candidatus Yanofskybacteria bacterium RIFCSPLOWO2_01_FULL_49_25]
MDITLYNQSGETIGTAQLPENIFAVPMNADVVHQALVTAQANARVAIAHAKGRGEVRGGGKKPWKQKGTGRARHASIRSPIWKGGGVTHGPTKERNFSKKINKKTARKALFMVLSSKVKDGVFMVVDQFRFNAPKTKEAVGVFDRLTPIMAHYVKTKKKRDSVLIVMPAKDRVLERAMRNLSFADVIAAPNLNIEAILSAKHIIMAQKAIPVMSEVFKL